MESGSWRWSGVHEISIAKRRIVDTVLESEGISSIHATRLASARFPWRSTPGGLRMGAVVGNEGVCDRCRGGRRGVRDRESFITRNNAGPHSSTNPRAKDAVTAMATNAWRLCPVLDKTWEIKKGDKAAKAMRGTPSSASHVNPASDLHLLVTNKRRCCWMERCLKHLFANRDMAMTATAAEIP